MVSSLQDYRINSEGFFYVRKEDFGKEEIVCFYYWDVPLVYFLCHLNRKGDLA